MASRRFLILFYPLAAGPVLSSWPFILLPTLSNQVSMFLN
jgi:hypothetical protein